MNVALKYYEKPGFNELNPDNIKIRLKWDKCKTVNILSISFHMFQNMWHAGNFLIRINEKPFFELANIHL